MLALPLLIPGKATACSRSEKPDSIFIENLQLHNETLPPLPRLDRRSPIDDSDRKVDGFYPAVLEAPR